MFHTTPEDLLCDRGGKSRQHRNKNQEKERKNVMSLKHNKHFRRIAAALMAGTMMVSMFGMTAFAEGGYGTDDLVPIQKKLVKEEYVYTPDATFIFKLTPAEAETEKGVKPGEPDAIVNGEVKIVFTPNDAELQQIDVIKNSLNNTDSATGFKFNKNAFDSVGIYHYQVSEVAGEYDGMAYDATVKDLYVYVSNKLDEEGNPTTDKELTYVMCEDGDKSAKSDSFTNNYGTTPEKPVENLTITKEVAGKLGNLETKFDFNIKITNNDASNEKYYIIIKNAEGEDITSSIMENQTIDENTVVNFALADGDTATVYGLSQDDTYVVTEVKNEKNTGYKIAVDTPENETNTVENNAIAKSSVLFINTNTGEVPATGLILNVAPYVLMVVLAGGLAFLFLRRRKNNF